MINGIPYPIAVKDETSFLAWIESIERKIGSSTSRSALPSAPISTTIKLIDHEHRELYRLAWFKHGDVKSESFAKALVCQQMAMELFSHLIEAPKGKLIWRIRPEFDVAVCNIPSDLSQVMTRKQAESALPIPTPIGTSMDAIKELLGKPDWATDFVTDSIFPIAAPLGEWYLFKCYMRYSIIVGNEVVYPRGIAA